MRTVNLPLIPSESTFVAKTFSFQRLPDKDRIVWFRDLAIINEYQEDNIDERNKMIFLLVDRNGISQKRIAEALDLSYSLVKQIIKKMRLSDGQIVPRRRRGSSRVLTEEAVIQINERLSRGKQLTDVAAEMDICLSTLCKGVTRGVINRPLPRPFITLSCFGNENDDSSSAPTSHRADRAQSDLDASSRLGMACVRVTERTVNLMMGNGAVSRFESCEAVEHGGVLTAIPALVGEGLFRHTAAMEEIFLKSYYQVTHFLLLLAFMALLRIKSPEALRGWAPGELGRLMGLDRIPEVSTLRRHLSNVATASQPWQDEIIKNWFSSLSAETVDDQITLYVDGHIQVYRGDMTPLPKRYSSRHRLCMAGVTQYWVNDKIGRPLMYISKTIDEGLQRTVLQDLMPKWEQFIPKPSLEEQAANPDWVWFRLIFDREGSSVKNLAELKKHHILAMTYKMRVKDEWPEEDFSEETVVSVTGVPNSMSLAEKTTVMQSTGGEKVKIKEIRRFLKGVRKDHQTSIITTDVNISMAQGAKLMFARWNQENYFKYMTAEYGLDHLLEYATKSLSLSEKVMNPAYREVEKQIRKVQGQLDSLNRRFKRTYENLPPEGSGVAYETKQIKKQEIVEEIQLLEAELTRKKEQRKTIDRKVSLGSLEEDERFAALASDRKMFVDVVKMAAYRAETAMALIVREESDSYGDEARSLLKRLFMQPADIELCPGNKTLNIKIYPLSEIRQCQVVEKMLNELNKSETFYPGTDWLMHYSIFRKKTDIERTEK